MDGPRVVLSAGGGVEVPADPEPLPRGEKLVVELGGYLGGGATLLFSADGDRRAVKIATRDHQHVVACGAVVAGEDVRGEIGSDDLADM